MRIKEFIVEYRHPNEQKVHRDGIDLESIIVGRDFQITASSHGREMGRVLFHINDNTLVPDDLWVEEQYRGQGISAVMYNWAKELGYRIERSDAQTDAGKHFWDKNRGDERVWESELAELNYPDELNVSDALQQHFIRRGYQVAGEGRDQIAFESPRGTVVKVVGLGDTHREDVVRQYVKFFVANQRNPYYPRIYNTGEFPVGDETYFVYEQEYLTYISDEEEVLEYIEDLMKAVPRGEQAIHAFQQNRPLPKSLDPGEVDGLVMATQDLEDHLGGSASLDLSMIENIRRRDNGHLVIMDPYSL